MIKLAIPLEGAKGTPSLSCIRQNKAKISHKLQQENK